MSWFQLSPTDLASRARGENAPATLPSAGASVLRGGLGFMVVSVAGFIPWAVFGHELHKRIGEAGLYSVCAAVFIGLSGLLLHRLIIGTGSLSRFYQLFSLSFAAYSIAWMSCWMSIRGHPGGLTGLFAGTLIMAWMLTRAFDARGALVKVAAALFVLNALGYFLGGILEGAVNGLAGRLLWGVSYGLGFGAGLGLAFYLCQAEARRLVRSDS